MKKTLLVSSLICLALQAQDLDKLLNEYARKADLSEQTKKESGGFLQVYTRQDLDRMQIRQLKELIEKIPFFRYREDNLGFSDPFYAPYQPTTTSGIRIYINDHALVNAYTGNGLKLYGQMDMANIDHVEIYLGIPSQTFGIEGAACVIKLYTKDPSRENTTLLGAVYGSRGTQHYYGYDAKVFGNFSYLAYADYSKLQRQKVRNDAGYTFKRDKEYGNFYGELRKEHHRFEFQAIRGRSDAFIGESWDMDSDDPKVDIRYLYGGWYYDNPENGWKASLNYADTVTDYSDEAIESALGIVELPVVTSYPPPFFHKERTKITEQVSDAQIKKRFVYRNFLSDTGIQARYKHFRFKEIELDDIKIDSDHEYDTEIVLSAFSENSYMIDDSNLLVGAIKLDRYLENGKISDRTLFSGRVGYIYNDGRWISKSFFMYSDFSPTMETLYLNRYKYDQREDPKTIHGYIGATKLIYNREKNSYAVMLSRTVHDNTLYFRYDPLRGEGKYTNYSQHMVFDTILLEYNHRFDGVNLFKLDLWKVINEYNNDLGSDRTYGGVASLTFTYDLFDIHNDLVYKYYPSFDPGLDWNFALTYHHSRRLNLFFKANNILGKALKMDYYTFNPVTGNVTELDDVTLFDKRVWVGMEYQF
ncbi:TonB-dependent receptor plug domain-containing protein [Hydrogenimonas sp.]